MTRIFLKPHWMILTGILAILVGANWTFFFHTPIHEWSDLAVNAIQIDRAKSFAEIYGNYSRFHFHHPGPAFFYWYAAFEWLLCDTLPTGLSPHIAHSLAGLVLQAGFFALAISLAATWIRHRLFVPMALVAGAIHYGVAGNAFLSIWPPHALLMPFLAFWVACVSIACGRGSHLPWVVLAGSFLVHGHVAQPLFVLAISAGAYAWHWRRLRTSGSPAPNPWRNEPSAHLVTGAILVIFIAPIVIDLLIGNPCNFRAILDHLQGNPGERKNPVQALLYFLSFFGYVRNQDTLLATLSPDSLAFFREQFWWFSAWAIAAVVAIIAWRRRRPEVPAETRLFLGTAAKFWVGTAALCIIWGMMQVGPMVEFNGHFFYSVNFVLLLVACAFAAHAIPDRLVVRGAGGVLLLAAAVIAWLGMRSTSVDDNSPGIGVQQVTLAALAADPRPAGPKRLVFSADEWPQVASVALALRRAGVKFFVDPTWIFMFESDHCGAVPAFGTPPADMTVWRFVRSVPTGGLPLHDGLRLTFEPAALSPQDGVIDFSERGNLEGHQLHGFATPEGEFAWTSQSDALLQFKPLPASNDVDLLIAAEPFLPRKLLAAQLVELRFNGEHLASASLTQPGMLHARITREQWNRHPVALLHLWLPNARSPAALGVSADPRILSLAVRRLTVRPVAAP